MQQQPYMEDQISVLGIAKDAAIASMLPHYAYKYNPGMWRPSYGRVMLNSIKDNPILNSKLGQFAGSKLTQGANWAANKLFDPESISNFKTGAKGILPGMRTGANNALSPIGLTIDRSIDGQLSFGLNKTKFSDTSFVKKLDAWRSNAKKRINGTSLSTLKAHASKIGGDILDLDQPLARRQSLSRALKGIDKQIATMKDISGTLGAKATRLIAKVSTAFSGVNIVTDNQALGQMHLLAANTLKAGYGAARGLGRGLFRAATAFGKGSAYYAVGSLMYEGIKMVANPIGQAATQAVDSTFNSINNMARPELGGQLNLAFISQGAATERQRAIQAISKSRMNGRSILGQEAGMMHA